MSSARTSTGGRSPSRSSRSSGRPRRDTCRARRRSTGSLRATSCRSSSRSRAVLADTERRVPPRGVLLVERAAHRVEEPALPAPSARRAADGARGRAESARGTALTTLEREPRPRIKRLVVGRPKSTGELEETLLPKRLALPIFASDALSSVAYATEAALVVLLAAAVTGRSQLLPVSIAIAALLAIVDRLLPADRSRLRVLRRRVHRREGQPRHAPEPGRRSCAAHRLRPHRRRLGRRGRGRSCLGGARA